MARSQAPIEIEAGGWPAAVAAIAATVANVIPPGTVVWTDTDGHLHARHLVPPSLLRQLEVTR